jgi:hypothetical protein
MLCKYYVAKVLREKKENNYDEKKIKIRRKKKERK